MTSNIMKVSSAEKSYKMIYGFLSPILGSIAVICAILCCFKSAEGSNARMVYAIIGISAFVLMMLSKLINDYCGKKNGAYVKYQSQAVQKMNPGVMIPLLIMLVVVVFPFYVILVTSLKTPFEANQYAFTWLPQKGIDFTSYVELFSFGSSIGVTMVKAVWNSFVYAIVPTVIGVFASALSAYAFSKLEFKGRDAMYQMLIMTMMMPGCVTMTTAYIMFDAYGWTNSSLPLIVPACFGAAATVMFLREFFMGIPDGLIEAATIDGAGRWRIFFSIILPLGRPALMAQLILGFITKYNDFVTPLIYLNDPEKYTIQIALDFLSVAVQDKAAIASAGVFSIVPMLMLYIIFQKRIIDGISLSSGLKG